MNLCQLCMPYYSISIIGMAKNSGKTTTLNKLVKELNNAGIRLGLTSVGRDGETVDVVTKTEKPQVYIIKETIIATAQALLQYCDITKEILLTTGINTPLGQVVMIRALSNGFVQLGGASINKFVAGMLKDFKSMGAEKVIVDGAVSRKTMASPAVTEAAILCTGASLNRSMDRVVSETAHIANMFSLPKAVDMDAINTDAFTGKVTRINDDCIFIKGAVSDSVISNLFSSDFNLKGLKIVVEDAGKLFITEGIYEKLLVKQGSIMVKKSINLLAVSINPVSPHGFSFDRDVFTGKLREKISIPVFNPLDEGAPWQ